MEKNYKYGRLYDFCVKDNYENPGRGVIKRKFRVLIGVLAYILLIVSLLTYILDIYQSIFLLIVVSLICFGFMYETRTGLTSLFNYYKVKSINLKISLSVLEKFALYHNKDGNYIKIQDKQMFKIKYHPFKWTTVKILFRDKHKNKYVFRINLKNIYVKICFSKGFKEEHLFRKINKLETTYKFNLNDLDGINNTSEFMIFLRDKYREIRDEINNQIFIR